MPLFTCFKEISKGIESGQLSTILYRYYNTHIRKRSTVCESIKQEFSTETMLSELCIVSSSLPVCSFPLSPLLYSTLICLLGLNERTSVNERNTMLVPSAPALIEGTVSPPLATHSEDNRGRCDRNEDASALRAGGRAFESNRIESDRYVDAPFDAAHNEASRIRKQ